MIKNLFKDQTTDLEDLPSTPRKKSQFKEQEFTNNPRIKYRYTIVEKPASGWLGNSFVALWLLLLLGSFVLSYHSKLTQLQISVKEDIEKCQKDYELNKCQTPLKGIKIFCQDKLKCLQSDPQQIMRTKMQGMLFLGTIIREFFEGLGLPLIAIGMVYMIFGSRKNKQVKKQFVEYH